MPCIVIDKKNPTKEDIVEAWFDNFIQKNPEVTPEIIQKEIEGAKDRITKTKLALWEGGGALGSTALASFSFRVCS